MNFSLDQIPQRTSQPRQNGLTMVMDKGLSTEEARNFMSVSYPHVDIVKLGFGTSVFSTQVKEKVKMYHDAKIKVYLGGTLFEACYVRGELDK